MKNKKLIIILITVISLIVLSVGAVVAIYFTTDIFKTNEQIFWKYFLGNSRIMSILSNENAKIQNELKNQNSYTTTGNLAISTQIGVSDPSKINIATSSIHDKNTGRTYADATLKKEDKDLLKVSYINSGNVYSIKCDDIYQYYIGFRNENLKQLLTTWGLEENLNIPDSIDFSALNTTLQLTDEEINHINETYSNVILQTIPKESYQKLGKETITINGKNYDANKYSLIVSFATMKQIVTNILTTLRNDTFTIEAINKRLNAITTLSNSDQNNNDVTTIIDQLLENISQKADNTEAENDNLTIFVYEKNGKTLRTVFQDVTGNVIIDLLENEFILSMPTNSSTYLDEEDLEYMQIAFSKTKGQNITNTITIMPDVNNSEEVITLSANIGSVQNGATNNSYSLIVNTISNDASTTQEISYNTQIATTNQTEEIMELKDDNSVIINNYPLEQLTTFFSSISGKVEQVFSNVQKELESELNALAISI